MSHFAMWARLPDFARERPLLLPKHEHSMMRAQPRRPRSPSHRAKPATPEARRYPLEGTSQPASARKPPDRTSKSQAPTIDPARRCHRCSGPHRPPSSRSPHEYERCILLTDAKNKGPCAPRSYGRCLVALYITIKPHTSLGRPCPHSPRGRLRELDMLRRSHAPLQDDSPARTQGNLTISNGPVRPPLIGPGEPAPEVVLASATANTKLTFHRRAVRRQKSCRGPRI